MKKKEFNLSEMHFSEVTSYKIHTLVGAQDGKSLIVYGKSELVDKNLHSTSICEEFQTKIFLNPRILLPSVLVKITAARDLQVLRVLDV